jgi:hypothetical protein
MPMNSGHGLGGASSPYIDDSCRLQHSVEPQTINEIGLAGFPLYQDRDLEKYNVCWYLLYVLSLNDSFDGTCSWYSFFDYKDSPDVPLVNVTVLKEVYQTGNGEHVESHPARRN